ncbi:transport permease protein [Streptomyces inusitatus]|uniref:Transport permease protein n=1 Tax=Streptomyces inusitatus TaxID=68221 RepID=A0A918UMJ5_9ACTN|nr:ABC transporter permease [Streptomyces inusitatus]GGZ21336.1 transport permease protein [Streptomyces inusitatus]
MSTSTSTSTTTSTGTSAGVTPGTAARTRPPAGGDSGRITPRAHLRHIGALVRRNALQIKQDPESMADAVLMPIIFTLLFTYVFGGAISGEGNQDKYVNYLVPGLMAMMGLSISMAVGTGINTDVNKGVMDRFRSMPIARSSILIAKIVVEVGRMTVAMVILLGMGFLLGLEIKTSVLELLAAMGLSLLFGASLMWIFILLGLALKTAQAVQGMAMLILLPLQFGSSIFAQPSTMPDWLKTFADHNPLSNLADASRALINGGELASSVWATLGWAAAITVVTAPLAIRAFQKKT